MIAIVAEKNEDKIKWNQHALALAEKTQDKRAHDWLGSLYNNLGQNYMDAKEFDKALDFYKKAVAYREQEGYAPNVRIAQWAVARALRALNRLDEAQKLLEKLAAEYEAMAKSKAFDVIPEIFNLVRGWVYEELAETYYAKGDHSKTQKFAELAYEDLSKDEMMRTTEAKRLERLKELKKQ